MLSVCGQHLCVLISQFAGQRVSVQTIEILFIALYVLIEPLLKLVGKDRGVTGKGMFSRPRNEHQLHHKCFVTLGSHLPLWPCVPSIVP